MTYYYFHKTASVPHKSTEDVQKSPSKRTRTLSPKKAAKLAEKQRLADLVKASSMSDVERDNANAGGRSTHMDESFETIGYAAEQPHYRTGQIGDGPALKQPVDVQCYRSWRLLDKQ